MALTMPDLDQRSAQDLVDWAKSELIPRHCPEWTDHNVSDPGIALIEVFAAMTEMLLYRVNRIPERLQLRLLELLGVQRKGPRAASCPVTFYLSAPQSSEVVIKAGTEVATLRTATSPEIIFSTTAPLIIRPPRIVALITENESRGNKPGRWTQHPLGADGQPTRPVALFPGVTAQNPGGRTDDRDAFYIGLEHDPSKHILSLAFTVGGGLPVGVQPENPPLQWEAQYLRAGSILDWAPLVAERNEALGFGDTLGGFSRSGRITFDLPEHMAQASYDGVTAYWLRCKVVNQQDKNQYKAAPVAVKIVAEAWGGTVRAEHSRLVEDEELGRSDGTPGQTFRLRYAPVLEPKADERLVVEYEGREEIWEQRDDFGASDQHSPHYTLDPITGTIRLGPTLVQADGTLFSFGKIPPLGSRLRMRRYRHGGGVAGNVAANELCVLKAQRSYVRAVQNRERATGGEHPQSLEELAVRAPEWLRTRDRAITAADYAALARQVPDVSRAIAYAPGNQAAAARPGMPPRPQPGKVVVVVLPKVTENDGKIAIDDIETLATDLEQQLRARIVPCVPLGTSVEFRAPQIYPVQVTVELRVPAATAQAQRNALESAVTHELYRYLNPYRGGPGGNGWPFGRTLRINELYGLIQPLLGTAYIDKLKVVLLRRGSSQPVEKQITTFPDDGIICSDVHSVTITADPV